MSESEKKPPLPSKGGSYLAEGDKLKLVQKPTKDADKKPASKPRRKAT